MDWFGEAVWKPATHLEVLSDKVHPLHLSRVYLFLLTGYLYTIIGMASIPTLPPTFHHYQQPIHLNPFINKIAIPASSAFLHAGQPENIIRQTIPSLLLTLLLFANSPAHLPPKVKLPGNSINLQTRYNNQTAIPRSANYMAWLSLFSPPKPHPILTAVIPESVPTKIVVPEMVGVANRFPVPICNEVITCPLAMFRA